MAEKKEKKVKDKVNFATKLTGNDRLMRLINRIFAALNIIVLGLIAYQLVQFFDVYSKRTDLMFTQGRIININPTDNNILWQEMTEDEIEQKRKEIIEGIKPPEPAAEISEDDPNFIGPKLPKAEEEKPVEEAAPAEPEKPVDYTTANLAIVITEVGMKNSELEQIKQLPKEVTLAFSPYSDDLDTKMSMAKRDGREVLLNIMLNPASFPLKDNGNFSIQGNYENAQNIIRFQNTQKLAKNYIGFLTTDNEIITKNIEKFTPILQKIKESNLFFGYFKNPDNNNLDNDLKPLAVSAFNIKYLVDEEADEQNIRAQLNIVKEDLILKKRKLVIAIHPNPISIRLLKEWLDENLGENIQIAPVSYFVINN